MKHRVGLGLTLAICAAAEAAEPVASPGPAATAVPVSTASVAAGPAPAPTPETKPAPAKPLDLRVGDVRLYMMPNEYHAALGAPDAEQNTVVVEAKRELLPVAYEKPIPTWPLGPLWWGLMHPAQSWRILLPDINNRPPDIPPDVVPPREFRWGP